jgi:hypothetical protein
MQTALSMVGSQVRAGDSVPTIKTGQSRISQGKFCVFITTSDRARDIFEIVYRNAETVWRDCDWPRYVGLTTDYPDMYGFKVLTAKGPGSWRDEMLDQFDKLPEQIEYVLRIDADALFMAPINGAELNAIADVMVRENLSYVRLVPVTRNFAGRLVEYVRRKFDRRPLRRISFSEPYYSSVELAIWKRSYFTKLLRDPGTQWEFERTVTKEAHYAVWKPLVEQHQIVTRGKWNWDARRLLARQGLTLIDSDRDFLGFGSWLRERREATSFQLFGFLSFRLRQRLNKISRH